MRSRRCPCLPCGIRVCVAVCGVALVIAVGIARLSGMRRRPRRQERYHTYPRRCVARPLPAWHPQTYWQFAPDPTVEVDDPAYELRIFTTSDEQHRIATESLASTQKRLNATVYATLYNASDWQFWKAGLAGGKDGGHTT